MPIFSPSSFSKLSTCHPDLQAIFYEVIKHYDCVINDVLFPTVVNVMPSCPSLRSRPEFFYFAGLVTGIAQKLRDDGKIIHGIKWGGHMESESDLARDLTFFELVP